MSLNKIKHRQFIQSMNLPNKVKIVEVGPRDGLQNQTKTISVTDKVELINRLSDCGLTSIEVGSLVSAKLMPQMADSDAVYQQIKYHPDIQYLMLVINQKGFDRAIKTGIKRIAVVCAASDEFSDKNINCTIEQSLINIQSICEQAIDKNISVRAYISCVLGCPYQGSVNNNQVGAIAARLQQYGCDEISLGDTIGIGTAGQVKELLDTLEHFVPIDNLAVHFHDTYGQALANILVALQSGVKIIDSSVSGLGGCPFAPGASGNVATEDVIYMLNGLGIESGIELNQLISTSWYISRILQRQPGSRIAQAQCKIQ